MRRPVRGGLRAVPPGLPSGAKENAVRATLDALSDGMRAGDSAAMRAAFRDDGLHTALDPSDTTAVQATSVAALPGRPHDRA